MPRIVFYIPVTLLQGQGQRLGSRSKVGVKVKGQGQRSWVKVNFPARSGRY